MTGGIVLAAGAGTRFGGPKQLARLGGRPLIEHAIAAQAAHIRPVVVVLGAHAERVLAEADVRPAEPVMCEGWEDGLSASLRAGIDALPGADALIVTLGDEPGVTADVVARIAGEPGTCRAAYGGRPGHPVRLDRTAAAQARTARGDVGARGVLRGIRLVECGDLADPHDVDTPSDLEAIRT